MIWSSVHEAQKYLAYPLLSLQRSEQELRSSLDKLKTSAQMLEGQLLRAQEDLLTLHHQQKETEEREK